MKRVSITFALLLALSAQADEPPATLPKEFLAQLPLLLRLSDREFEGLLASARQQRRAETPPQGSTEEKNHED